MDPLELALQRILGFTAPDGQNYGREVSLFRRDALDDVVDNYIVQAVDRHQCESEDPPEVLDIGGATGNRAAQFAGMGAKALVTALDDCSSEILARNKELGRDALRFLQQDIRKAKREDLANNVWGGWSLIHMRRVLHWMPWNEVGKVLTFLPEISGSETHLAMCITHWPKHIIEKHKQENPRGEPFLEDNFINCRAQKIADALRKAGYKILFRNEEPTPQGAISCQFFTEMPRPR